jgi:hypothetical protein
MMFRKIDILIAALFVLNLGLNPAEKINSVQSAAGSEKKSLIQNISFIDLKNYTGRNPPSNLVLGINVGKDVFYKLSDSHAVLKGGLLKSGFNTVSIESRDLFSGSGTYAYSLEVKAGPVIQKQYFDIEIVLDLPPQPAAPEKKPEEKSEDKIYQLSLYIGDRLIASGQKTQKNKPDLKIELPPSHGAFQPFGPPERDDPMMHSVPIPVVLAEAYKLIKNAVKKRKAKKQASQARMVKQMTASFLRLNSAGAEIEVEAQISLKMKD